MSLFELGVINNAIKIIYLLLCLVEVEVNFFQMVIMPFSAWGYIPTYETLAVNPCHIIFDYHEVGVIEMMAKF